MLAAGLLNFGDPNYGAGGPEGTLMGPIPNLKRLGLSYDTFTRQQIEQVSQRASLRLLHMQCCAATSHHLCIHVR